MDIEAYGSAVDSVAEACSMQTVVCSNQQPVMKIHRKMYCRYGRGCTHITDPQHQDKFWHPAIPRIDDDQRRTHYICNECGFSSQSLHDLQLHLQRKTAWSNLSLVGCRISCLVESKEWHEGYVGQFHRAGKHLIQFRVSGESKWLNMKKAVFYILERPVACHDRDDPEFKDGGDDYLAPIEDEWVYVEDISLDFAFAQSVLFKVYGSVIQETGHKTRGHVCLTEDDKDWMAQTKGSLLYGELLPRGANKAFGVERLNLSEAATIFDLGMGTGKILIQAFLQYRNLQYVYGVELSAGRYSLAEEASLRMVELLGRDTFKIQNLPGRYIIITELVAVGKGRVLHLECGDLFAVQNIEVADVLMMETDVPLHLLPKLSELLSRMHEGARCLSYLDLRRFWTPSPCPFVQMACNKPLSDRFPTSWSVQRGHHFFLWTKIIFSPPAVDGESGLDGPVLDISAASADADAADYDDEVSMSSVSTTWYSWLPFRWPMRRLTNKTTTAVTAAHSVHQSFDKVIPVVSPPRNLLAAGESTAHNSSSTSAALPSSLPSPRVVSDSEASSSGSPAAPLPEKSPNGNSWERSEPSRAQDAEFESCCRIS